MKVLLTGHSGFIGQNLLKYLLKKKINLFVTKHNNIKIFGKKNINIIDLNNRLNQKNYLTDFDLVIHAAWSSLENYNSTNHLKKILPENIKFLKKLIYLGAKNLVVLGTCFELGDCFGEVKETQIMKPNTQYGKAKKLLYDKLISLQKKQFFNLTWIRIFYIYGSTQRNKSIFSQLKNFNAMQSGKVFELTEGKQLRDYMHVTTLAKKIIDLSFLNKDFGIVNVCSGKPISIKNLVLKWKNKFKWKIKFKFGSKSLKKYEPNSFWGSTLKLKTILK
jgi:nucleoside-diphosphate-sugar epimerase